MKKIIVILFLLLTACGDDQRLATQATPTAPVSIQARVNAAGTGEVITIQAGDYPETVRIDKSGITVRCAVPLQCKVKRFEVYGSNNTVDGFAIAGGLSAGVEVRQHDNAIRNIDISGILYDFGLPNGQGATVGIAFFGSGHVFENINIHDIDQYHVDDLGYSEPHQDCFISWNVPARGGSGSYITISNVICNMPQSGDSFVSKVFASSGGSHHWTVKNLVSYTPLPCLFYDEAHHIDISYSTFVGAGETPQGCKFVKINSNPAPHDNTITHSIFQNITQTKPFYDYVTGHDNCFWNVTNHMADPGDIFANPLLLPDWTLAAGSLCAGMGAFPSAITSTQTATNTIIPTVTNTPTLTATQTRTPTKTPTVKPTTTPQCFNVSPSGKICYWATP